MKRKIICILVLALLTTSMIIPMVSGIEYVKKSSRGIIDQKQEDTSENHFLDNGKAHYQQFENQGQTIEEVQVHIGHYFGGSKPLTLSIKDSVGTILTFKTLTTADIPENHLAWCSFDVPDKSITPGELYFIVLEFDIGSEYAWSGVHGNPYPKGISSHPDLDWDYAFRTIVDKKSKTNNLSPGVVDQEQTNTAEMYWLTAGVPNYQEFKNNGHTIEKVIVHIGNYYQGSQPMTLSIERPLGTKITFKTLTASDIPPQAQDWCEFDVPDKPLDIGANYYIVIEFAVGSEYAWSGAHGDPYTLGGSSHPDSDWDFAFKTIVDKKSKSINKSLEFIFNIFQNLISKFPMIAKFL